jgi:hypothetical protein
MDPSLSLQLIVFVLSVLGLHVITQKAVFINLTAELYLVAR